MNGNWIDIKTSHDSKFQGYLSVPDCGTGPGLIIGQEIFGVNKTMRQIADYFAEEGYVVLVPDMFWRLTERVELAYNEEDFKTAFGYFGKFDLDLAIEDISISMDKLKSLDECTGSVGYMGFCLGGKLAYLTASKLEPEVAISFYGVGIPDMLDQANNVTCPMIFHCPELDEWMPPEGVKALRNAFESRDDIEIYDYPGADHGFFNHDRDVFHKPSVSMAHSRTIGVLRKVLGPNYDLSALWDKHCEYEFLRRDVDATMSTMVSEPYVNHIPTLTGGVGFKELHRFYLNHFVHSNPEDTKLVPVSRTVGADRVVDEMLFCFTHNTEIDWMLPGVKPTGKYVEIPVVGIINFRGDKLCHEHIYWDQASVLVQIGLLSNSELPVSGRIEAKKMMDPKSIPSNNNMDRWSESEPQ
ncbi:MAG: carboxymethylenebutenolidase [Rhodospirillaceae bacterium]|nr:carboxymethylenebutenolidase [Rhodospirillaceae bacterium]